MKAYVLKQKHAGFTYIELVVAIVIMAIIAIGLTQFIVDSADSYVSTNQRSKLSSAGRVAIDRMSMEVHNAVPNSIRFSPRKDSGHADVLGGLVNAGDQCMEFVPTRVATTYIDPSFRRVGSSAFDAVEFLPDQTGVASPLYAIIYPNNTAQLYQEPVPAPPARGPRAQITSIAHDGVVNDVDNITLSAAHRFRRRSRVERLFLAEQPVSYCITGEKLFRYSNYGFSTTQLLPVSLGGACAAASCLPSTTPNRVLITDSVDVGPLTDAGSQAFDYLLPTRRRNGVVQLELSFSNLSDSVLLNHEVIVQGAP